MPKTYLAIIALSVLAHLIIIILAGQQAISPLGTNAALCKKWVEGGFLEMVDASNKARTYKLAGLYEGIVKGRS